MNTSQVQAMVDRLERAQKPKSIEGVRRELGIRERKPKVSSVTLQFWDRCEYKDEILKMSSRYLRDDMELGRYDGIPNHRYFDALGKAGYPVNGTMGGKELYKIAREITICSTLQKREMDKIVFEGVKSPHDTKQLAKKHVGRLRYPRVTEALTNAKRYINEGGNLAYLNHLSSSGIEFPEVFITSMYDRISILEERHIPVLLDFAKGVVECISVPPPHSHNSIRHISRLAKKYVDKKSFGMRKLYTYNRARNFLEIRDTESYLAELSMDLPEFKEEYLDVLKDYKSIKYVEHDLVAFATEIRELLNPNKPTRRTSNIFTSIPKPEEFIGDLLTHMRTQDKGIEDIKRFREYENKKSESTTPKPTKTITKEEVDEEIQKAVLNAIVKFKGNPTGPLTEDMENKVTTKSLVVVDGDKPLDLEPKDRSIHHLSALAMTLSTVIVVAYFIFG